MAQRLSVTFEPPPTRAHKMGTSRICRLEVTDIGWRRSRILGAEVAGSGIMDLRGRWWFLGWRCRVLGLRRGSQ